MCLGNGQGGEEGGSARKALRFHLAPLIFAGVNSRISVEAPGEEGGGSETFLEAMRRASSMRLMRE